MFSQTDGTKSLKSAPSLLCHDTWWNNLLPTALSCCIIYGLGIPILFIKILKSRPVYNLPAYKRPVYIKFEKYFLNKFIFHSSQQHDYEIAMTRWYKAYAPLSSQYKYHAFYWELMILSRKTLLTLSMVFASDYPLFQAGLAGFILFISTLFHEKYQPYYNDKLNLLELITLLCCMFSLLFAIMISDDQDSVEFPPIMISIVGFIILSFMASSVLYIIYLVIKMIIKHQKIDEKPVHLYPEDSLINYDEETAAAAEYSKKKKKKNWIKKKISKKKFSKKKFSKKKKKNLTSLNIPIYHYDDETTDSEHHIIKNKIDHHLHNDDVYNKLLIQDENKPFHEDDLFHILNKIDQVQNSEIKTSSKSSSIALQIHQTSESDSQTSESGESDSDSSYDSDETE